jgi:hypothetical protein
MQKIQTTKHSISMQTMRYAVPCGVGAWFVTPWLWIPCGLLAAASIYLWKNRALLAQIEANELEQQRQIAVERTRR